MHVAPVNRTPVLHRPTSSSSVRPGPLLLLTVVVTLLMACARSGDVSGDFYYTTHEGDVRRLADREIVLVRASKDLDAEWNGAGAAFIAEFERAKPKLDELVSYLDQQAAKTDDPRLRHEFEATKIAAFSVVSIRADKYSEWALAWVARHRVAAVRTDISGHYEFRQVQAGRYHVFAEAEVDGERHRWFVPVEIGRQRKTVDLTMRNMGPYGEGEWWCCPGVVR